MIDTGANIIVIPKIITNEMKLYITRCIDGFIHLDSSLVDVIGSVKGVFITLNALPNICIIQDIIVVDILPLFRIYLSREFTMKLGVSLALDYAHLLLSFQNKHIKIPNECTKNIHIKKITKQNCKNDLEQVETFERNPLMESLLNINILLANDLNY